MQVLDTAVKIHSAKDIQYGLRHVPQALADLFCRLSYEASYTG
jgi:hypothetical protein